MGKANKQICIFTTLFSNGIYVRDYTSEKMKAVRLRRLGCQLEAKQANAYSESVAGASRQPG